MRLNNEQIKIIKDIIRVNFGAAAKLKLFGIRLDDSKKGEDIDLLVEADFGQEETFLKKIATLGQLQRALGEQKIDLLTTTPTATENVSDIVKISEISGRRIPFVFVCFNIGKNCLYMLLFI